MDPIFTQQFNMPPPQSGGMFGGGGKFGIGQAIVAALNGYLASQPGGAGEVGRNNMQMMAAIRQRELDRQQTLADYNRHRADDNTDYVTHLQQKAQYDTPAQDEMTRHMIAAGIDPNSAQGKALYAASLDPVVLGPQGPMTRSQLLGGGGQPAPAGITFTPIPEQGGPASQAPGGFPY